MNRGRLPETQRRYDCAHSACEHSTRGKCSSRRRLAEQAGGWGLPPYRFTGKEEDVQVGLQYFGKRYLNPLLGRWMSADPLAVHAPGEADLNLYAYVSGAVLKNVDPLGLEETVSVASVEQHAGGSQTVTLNEVRIVGTLIGSEPRKGTTKVFHPYSSRVDSSTVQVKWQSDDGEVHSVVSDERPLAKDGGLAVSGSVFVEAGAGNALGGAKVSGELGAYSDLDEGDDLFMAAKGTVSGVNSSGSSAFSEGPKAGGTALAKVVPSSGMGLKVAVGSGLGALQAPETFTLTAMGFKLSLTLDNGELIAAKASCCNTKDVLGTSSSVPSASGAAYGSSGDAMWGYNRESGTDRLPVVPPEAPVNIETDQELPVSSASE